VKDGNGCQVSLINDLIRIEKWNLLFETGLVEKNEVEIVKFFSFYDVSWPQKKEMVKKNLSF